MDINNKTRIHWACRRGMRELDIAIMPFFENDYDNLSDADKQVFIRLLECEDPQLYRWLMNQAIPEEADMARMIKMIQKKNAERSSLA
ncbi:FAD assembly factor SdhE [Budviciaceae bacterium CWB-B4]|uniref:FAD assembly factor SdhE n=1 Tax=Limnobaculum xujianqingii TaxID=2738837 RepID=A0A9D7FYA7_9GAMM|nr:FAD assembly factor SdhE [Limnobaculum xujianqingii]MBK5073458.1 FAD assembly factor SdhE [Limnobaculum xujianqingii]MBK5176811.1 FAD assembly factor SdhE [Limnobaculum xujianqingii]